MTTPPDYGDDPLAYAVEIMERIRRDGEWESAQTHTSLLSYLVEETWELVDAVEGGGRDEIVSELGDLLLQVLFHSAIGAERRDGAFDVRDVATALLDKLHDRAPYWFTEEGAAGLSAEDQDRLWQEAKARRKAAAAGGAGGAAGGSGAGAGAGSGAGAADSPGAASTPAAPGARAPAPDAPGLFDGISWTQPALALGQDVLTRARELGVPDEDIPDNVRVVRVEPRDRIFAGGTAEEADSAASPAGSGSAELDYRARLREFVNRVEVSRR